jgi:hypothetical protein
METQILLSKRKVIFSTGNEMSDSSSEREITFSV